MTGQLFAVHYSTRHNAKMMVSVGKLCVFIHAKDGVEACVKAIRLLCEDDMLIEGVEKIV